MYADAHLPEQSNHIENADITDAYIDDGIERLEVYANTSTELAPAKQPPTPERSLPEIIKELKPIAEYVTILRNGHLQ